MRVVEAIADAIHSEGVEIAFSLPDEVTVHLAQALSDEGVRVVRGRHEHNVVAMADGYARATGLAVCTVGGGPALAQTGNALVTAQRRGSGVLVVVGDNPPGHIKEFDAMRYAESLGIRYTRVRSAATLKEDVEKAFRLVRQDSGPVLFAMGDLALLGTDVRGTWSYEGTQQGARYPDPDGQSELVMDVAALLANAKRPVILAGRGAVRSGAGPAIEMLANRLGALVGTSLQARGYFNDSARGIGIVGGFGTEASEDLFLKADCVLAVGIALNRYQTEVLGPDAEIIQIDTNENRIGKTTRVGRAIIGDAAATVIAINSSLEQAEIADTSLWTLEDAAQVSASTHVPDESSNTDLLSVPQVLARIEQVLPTRRVIVADAGRFLGPTMDLLSVPDPHSWFWTCDFGSIGLGLPMGIGVQLARSDQPCLVVAGDGGFMMNIQELETAVRERIPLTIVVCDNHAYASEVNQLRGMDKPTEMALFDEVDFAAVARSFGAEAMTIRSLEELNGLESCVPSGDVPLVIDAKVDIEAPHRAFETAFARAH